MPNKGSPILEAPSILGLFPKGVETLPDALLGGSPTNSALRMPDVRTTRL